MPHKPASRVHSQRMTEDLPAFFFPGAASPEQAEQFREAVVRFARDNGFPATPRRIFRLEHHVDGISRRDQVGQVECQDQHEVVVAILQAGTLFLVVTPSRGFQRGTPIPYREDEVTGVTDFRT